MLLLLFSSASSGGGEEPIPPIIDEPFVNTAGVRQRVELPHFLRPQPPLPPPIVCSAASGQGKQSSAGTLLVSVKAKAATLSSVEETFAELDMEMIAAFRSEQIKQISSVSGNLKANCSSMSSQIAVRCDAGGNLSLSLKIKSGGESVVPSYDGGHMEQYIPDAA